MAEKNDKWLPLEANPHVMNKYVKHLGMGTTYQFHDVFGLEPDLLEMIPQPCIALLLLFPINDKYIVYEKEEQARIEKDGQVVSASVYFMKQTIGNACGTVGLLHALGNCTDSIALREGGFLKTFFEKTKLMTPEEIAKFLEEDKNISEAHDISAQEGDTAPPEPEEDVRLHFVCLIHKDGHIYELDGRKNWPVNHGATTAADFLLDAAKICQNFMSRDPSELHFSVVALAAASQ